MVIDYLNKLSVEKGTEYGFNSAEYKEFKIFYDKIVDLLKQLEELSLK